MNSYTLATNKYMTPYFAADENQATMRPMKAISERVKERMALLGLTQKRLAKLCGVEQPQISLLLKGTVRNPTYIYELSKALETSIKWLKTGIEDIPVEIPKAVGEVPRSSYQRAVNSMTATEEAAEIFKIILTAAPDTQRQLTEWLNKIMDSHPHASSGKSAESKKNDNP